MSKSEKILDAFTILNATIPGIAKVIVTLTDGEELDIGDLCNKTESIVEKALKKAREHLAKHG